MLLLSLVGWQTGFAKEIIGSVRHMDQKKIGLAGATITVVNKHIHSTTDKDGNFKIEADENDKLTISLLGFNNSTVQVSKKNKLIIYLSPISTSAPTLLDEEVVVAAYSSPNILTANIRTKGNYSVRPERLVFKGFQTAASSETYGTIEENKFMSPTKEPLSTFAVDVDAASYSNVRRIINSGSIPEKDAIRIEEMINYFQYDLQAPTNGDPVKIYTELTTAPWNTKHQLLRIALKAKNIPSTNLPASNFVFLIDVSGSMNGYNRLPLVQSSLKLLVDQLRPQDQVAIVTYAGTSQIKLSSTSGSQKMKIKQAIDELQAGGSTAGAAGIMLAYQMAKENFKDQGNNRIILASDGDFNVGVSSDKDMESLITNERKSGVHLTVLGFGMGNLKDSKMELLANKGHGNYAYIDNIAEARKAMVTEFGGTLFTVAKDVKVQVEFNPAYVQAYRLLGYENRLLAAEDFNNDQKLGGDMGVGHAVTAIYEIVPVGVQSNWSGAIDPLKYQQNTPGKKGSNNAELATVKFRYKEPTSDQSKMQFVVVKNTVTPLNSTSEDFRFATSVAELGMLLRQSDYKQQANFDQLIARAKQSKGKDDEGYRAEFIRMAENSKSLMGLNQVAVKTMKE